MSYLPHIVFSRDTSLGTFSFRPVEPRADTPLLHAWLSHPKSAYWLMQHATEEDIEREFSDIIVSTSRNAFVGLHQNRPAFLAETYDPAHSSLAEHYAVRSGDVGMHFLVAPTDSPISGFTRAVLVTVMELLFADPATQRVVVEPDVRNQAVHTLNATVGFRVRGTVPVPEMNKDAYLSICSRHDYRATR